MKKIKLFFKRILGITRLQNRINYLEREQNQILDKLRDLRNYTDHVNLDNGLILNHIRFLNENFFVGSDINPNKYGPSIVMVVKLGNQEIVKTYYFNDETTEGIYRMLEGFGKDRNKIDKPRHFRGPNYRY